MKVVILVNGLKRIASLKPFKNKMKKLLLFSTSLLTGIAAFAQDARFATPTATPTAHSAESIFGQGTANKTTGLTDTLYFGTTAQVSGPFTNYVDDVVAPFDSGRYYGINAENFKGFAQLYRYGSVNAVNPQDTTYNIVGLVSRWAGNKSATSTRQITFNIWKRDSTSANKKLAIPGRAKFFIWAPPVATATATRSIPITSLVTTNAAGMAGNTITYLTAPLTGITYDIYAGYTVSYTWGSTAGDTVGLSTAGTSSGTYTIETGTLDSLISTSTLIMNSAGAWKSPAFDNDYFNGGSLVLYPMIQLSCPTCNDPTSVRGFNRNDLTFFGTFPNPAINNTSIRFALKKSADVTITVMDATGKNISVSKQTFTAGEHTAPLNIQQLASGNYVCMLETSNGDGMATQFTVTK